MTCKLGYFKSYFGDPVLVHGCVVEFVICARAFSKVLPDMVFPPIFGEKLAHAHANYPGLALIAPGFNPLSSGTGLGVWISRWNSVSLVWYITSKRLEFLGKTIYHNWIQGSDNTILIIVIPTFVACNANQIWARLIIARKHAGLPANELLKKLHIYLLDFPSFTTSGGWRQLYYPGWQYSNVFHDIFGKISFLATSVLAFFFKRKIFLELICDDILLCITSRPSVATSFPAETCPCKNQTRAPFWRSYINVN